jgi:quercetin dioxygenase-like cupin family protein
MFTRRDLAVALISFACAGAGFAAVGKLGALGSMAIDWNTVAGKPTDAGSVRSFIDAPTATLQHLEVHATTLNPGKSPHPPHHHPNEEMIIVHSGTVDAMVNDAWKRVGPGAVIFFASNQLHGLRNPGTEPAVYHVINWKTIETPVESTP